MKPKGFTLAELAIALFIIALLLGGTMLPLSAQIEVRNVTDTRRTMDQIKEALVGFAQAGGRLPCPALGSLATSTAGAGGEQWDSVNNRCSAALGVIPWATLGVPETDAWGRRFTYRVSPAFADAVSVATYESRTATMPASPANQAPSCSPTPTPSQSSFALCSLGDMTVLTRSDGNHASFTPVGTGLPAVFVSHGKNGLGAFQSNGVRLTGSGGADEAANSSGTVTATPGSGYNYLSFSFYSRNATPSAAGCSDTSGTVFCEFDDIVAMIPSSILVTRMVSAGKLP
jgi:prepilin-type N-terminal cleavage/methylation domain-containing protein